MARKTGWLMMPCYVALLALIIWWWWRETERKIEPAAGLMGGRPPEPRLKAFTLPVAPAPVEAPAAEPLPPAARAQTAATGADDLKRIEGVGPKIASVLGAAGILSYAHLAAAAPGRLEEILAGAGIRLADPATWPEQAALAAAGDWQGLVLLQSQLKGGRRVA
jgi:predicted flap endonuclease-1-like 5' DNA nuclease